MNQSILMYWLLLIVINQLIRTSSANQRIARLDTKSLQIQHLSIDERSNQLYIGATNQLLQIDLSNFSISTALTTGPVRDSVYCNYNGKDCIKQRTNPSSIITNDDESLERASINRRALQTNDTMTLTDNSNQILLIDRLNDRLIVCGSVRQGVCTVHHLSDIGQDMAQPAHPVAVAANSHNASTVAFIANQTMFVAATWTYEPYRDAFPAVASRSLSPDRTFQLIDDSSVSSQSALQIQAGYRSDYRVSYVHGFSYNGFAFWTQVQKRSPTEHNSPFETKIARICENDKRYESYSELGLQCLGPDNSQFNLLKAAFVGEMGRKVLAAVPRDYLDTDNEDHTQFLIGVFGRESPDSSKSAGAAICVYPLKEIQSAFRLNIQRCHMGVGHWNLPHFGLNQKCINISHYVTLNEKSSSSCKFGHIGGTIPSVKASILTVRDTQVTALLAHVIDQEHTVLHLGTADGRLKRVLLSSLNAGQEYSDWQVSQTRTPIGRDLRLSGSFLYASSGRELLKIPLASCQEHKTCATCLQAADPYCGWCTLENRCTARAECSTAYIASASDDTSRAVTDEFKCPRLLQPLQPSNVSVFESVQTTVTLRLSNLPAPPNESTYRCIYGVDAMVDATFTAPDTIQCALPPYDVRPKIPNNQDHVILPLQLWSSATSKVFHEQPFIFYDCGAQQLCTSCVSSRWSCRWCLLDNRCVHDVSLCSNQSAATGASFCPHIDSTKMQKDELLFASGHKVEIRLPVVNLDSLLEQQSNGESNALSCVVSDRALHRVQVSASFSANGYVTCAAHAYRVLEGAKDVPNTLNASASIQEATVALVGARKQIIDETKIHLYKCESMASDCSRCLSLDAKFDCDWCGGGCRFRAFCPFGTANSKQRAVNVCPAPKIVDVHPLSGPIEGGTELTITGHDLGTSVDEIRSRVFVGGLPCAVTDYEVSRKIVCSTSTSTSSLAGNIRISLDANRTSTSAQQFVYVNPELNDVQPRYGPASGGTRLRITGQHLKSATAVSVGTLPCAISEMTDRHIECMTSAAPMSPWTAKDVSVQLDAANRTLQVTYLYAPDPEISLVTPLATFANGGRLLKVTGRNLNVTKSVKIYLVDPIQLREQQSLPNKTKTDQNHLVQLPPLASDFGDCTAQDSHVMFCRSPKILPKYGESKPQFRRKRKNTPSPRAIAFDEPVSETATDLSQYPKWPVGFLMDNVQELRNLGNRMQLTVTPDPELDEFPTQGKRYYTGELVGTKKHSLSNSATEEEQAPKLPLLHLAGRRLNLAANERDVAVWIGSTSTCNVTRLEHNQLSCQPTLPLKSGDVIVKIGNLQQNLGPLRVINGPYDPLHPDIEGLQLERSWTTWLLIVMIVFTLFSLLMVLVCVAVWWKRKSSLAEKEYRRIQLQMENLETNVRHECKQAFAELQTDMLASNADLGADLVPHEIPFHPRRVYAARIMFKEEINRDHLLNLDAELYISGGAHSNMQRALAQLDSLLWNRQFLATVVNVCENQKTFTAPDKSHVGSLLTAILSRNMPYLTDVVLLLLSRLIAKNVSGKHAHLMLRRNESVVERMLANWLALTQYDQLTDQHDLGQSLFLLYCGLKHQLQRGPVDSVTGDARYSLSEDRLLKEHIDYEQMTVHVIPLDDAGVTVACRVLSCDSVAQCKAKIMDTIYRNYPFSQRPSLGDIDLDWRQDVHGASISILREEDNPSPAPTSGSCAAPCRRVLTLKDFAVPNNAVLALVNKRRPQSAGTGYYQTRTSHTSVSLTSSTHLIPSPGTNSPDQSNSSNSSTHSNSQYWHLIRPSSSNSSGSSPSTGISSLGLSATTLGRRSAHSRTALISNSACTIGHNHLGQHYHNQNNQGTLPKAIPEIYLTRLLTSKGTVQSFVDEFFDSIFSSGAQQMPVVKYLFEFMETEAAKHQINDPSILSAWQNNALPLRYWVNLVKNPEFIFDVDHKSAPLDSCLSVIAATLMDACSATAPRLSKDSPSNKLLFAKDLPRYRQKVQQFYTCMQHESSVPAVQIQDLMQKLSKAYAGAFNVTWCLRELLPFVVKYELAISNALKQDPTLNNSNGHSLMGRFDDLLTTIGIERHQHKANRTHYPEENIYAVVA